MRPHTATALRAVTLAATAGTAGAVLVLAGASPGYAARPGHAASPGYAASHGHRWVSGPTPTAAQAGYVASGRSFRYAQAVIAEPAARCGAGDAMPRLYVALAGQGTDVRAGLQCGAGRWEAFAQILRPWRPPVTSVFPLWGVRAGAGVFASVHLGGAGALRCWFMTPGGTGFGRSATLPGVAFTQAQALADWSGTGRGPGQAARKYRLTQFLSGAFTTVNGRHGVFTGPWNSAGRIYGHAWRVRRVEAVVRGVPAAAPSYLWTDGTQAAFGSWGDAFGVWRHR
jgi:hypothetical protein